MTNSSVSSVIFETAKAAGVRPSFVRKLVLESDREWLQQRSFKISPERFASTLEDELSYYVDNGLAPLCKFA